MVVDNVRKELAIREMARRRLRYFIPYVFPEYQVKPHNQLICDAVDLAVNGIIERLMIFCPPQYGKSEIVSRKTVPYVLGKYPEKKVILSSYASSLANDLSRHARNVILSQPFQNLFGDFSSRYLDPITLSDESRSVHTWELEGHRGGMVAAGVGGGIAGKPADFAIIDDPVKDDSEAVSELVRDTHFSWFWGILHARLSPHAPIILCMTRWNEDDLAGRLLANQEHVGEFWYVLRLSAMAETPEEIARWAEVNHVDVDHFLTREKIDELARI